MNLSEPHTNAVYVNIISRDLMLAEFIITFCDIGTIYHKLQFFSL